MHAVCFLFKNFLIGQEGGMDYYCHSIHALAIGIHPTPPSVLLEGNFRNKNACAYVAGFFVAHLTNWTSPK